MSNIVLAIIVTMGMMGGGMVALGLMAPRRNQTIFALMAAIALVLGLAAVGVAALETLRDSRAGLLLAGLVNLGNLALAGGLGYAVTTYFVLNRQPVAAPDLPDRQASALAAGDGAGKTAVLYFAPGEPEEYDLQVLARGLDTQEYRQGAPPVLLRPFYFFRLKAQYDAIGRSPARPSHLRLAQKVQDRLGRRVKVYICFYNDQPSLAEAAAQAILDGARRLIVLHARLTDPPPQVRVPDLLAVLRPERYGVTVVETAAQWDSELLLRLFVRRAQAAVPAEARAQAGLLLAGQGHPVLSHPAPGARDTEAILHRQNQELSFQKRVRQILIRGGFSEDKVVIGWLHWQEPTLTSAQIQLRTEQAMPLYWLGTGFPVEGLATLYAIPQRLQAGTAPGAVAQPLGAWSDDDLVAEALVEKVKEVLPAEPAGRTPLAGVRGQGAAKIS